jgi:muramoyltetrapeptide carboxypeptidase
MRAALRPARPIGPGARLAVIAPSSPFDADAFAAGVARLRERYDVGFDDGVLARRGYFAGDDIRRLAELQAAITDDAVHGILVARGGYGATRLLDGLDVDAIARAGKVIAGFSDVTALHALWARAGVRSLHGPMVATLGRAPPAEVERFVAALEGAPVRFDALTTITPGTAEGPLLGGNLAVLAALSGTPHAPPLDGAILFLEDVGEKPYRIDRMLTTLRQSGALARVAGVALGAFSECTANAGGVTGDDVLRERLAGLGVPVVAGVPAGHVDDNAPLPFGATARIRATIDRSSANLATDDGLVAGRA